MPIPSRLDQVKELLASGKTEDAADLLLKLAKNSEDAHYKSALLLKNQLEILQHDSIDGILSAGEERIGWAKISRRIVDLTEQIERGERPMRAEEVVPPPAQKKAPATSFPKKWLWALLAILVIGGAVAVPKILNSGKATQKEPATTTRPVQKEKKKVALKGRLVIGAKKIPAPNAEIRIENLDNKYFATTNRRGQFTLEIFASDINKLVTPKVKINRRSTTLPNVKLTEAHFRELVVSGN
ncbi:MAG TPA: hypothetical protein ENJ95_02045 [Bacteroidetes bacterium]|nr:hypothetical protein [Bacteroidota bacterium]